MANKKDRVKTLVIIASACWMFGEGLRMVVESVKADSVYVPSLNGIDIWFDWIPLMILGGIMFYFGIMEFYARAEIEKKGDGAIGVTRSSSSNRFKGFGRTAATKRR